MVVFSMNSKRIRRPNVRLWEVGDLSAAFTCGISELNNGSTQHKWKNDFSDHVQESECIQIATTKQLESTTLDPGISPRIFKKNQHNIENWDPNSSKLVSESSIKSKSKLDFGAIPRRSRVMKRRRRSRNSISRLFCPWKAEPGCKVSREDEKGYEWNRLDGCSSDTGFHFDNGKDFSENETSGMSRDTCDSKLDDQNFRMEMMQRPNETWTEATWYKENTASPQFTYEQNEISHDSDVNSVREWLEELGFGKFADLFKLHEVDEETLQLITFEDLKDMGIDAVGPRRKLFTAIRQLRRGR